MLPMQTSQEMNPNFYVGFSVIGDEKADWSERDHGAQSPKVENQVMAATSFAASLSLCFLIEWALHPWTQPVSTELNYKNSKEHLNIWWKLSQLWCQKHWL